MIKKAKLIIAGFLATGLLVLPVLVPATVAAEEPPTTQTGLCEGANLQVSADPNASNCTVNSEDTVNTVNKTIALIINIFSLIVGVVAVIMIIIGGLRYIISGGDSGNVTSAKNTILYAIIGLVVVALAQFVVKFVLTKVFNASNQG